MKITVRELIEDLKTFNPDAQVIFGCEELIFFRTKGRGNELVQIEFNQSIYKVNGKFIVEDYGEDSEEVKISK